MKNSRPPRKNCSRSTKSCTQSICARVRPDVAVIDIGMPILNGYDVAKSIRREPWGAALTLIAVTGWGQDDDKRAALAAGFDRHLTKPVDPEHLQRLLAGRQSTEIP
jgi:CheY-like chemotaxis protein